MSQFDKNIDRKVIRMESDYHELVVKTQYLKASKQKIKKDIEFYKAVISKVAFIYDANVE